MVNYLETVIVSVYFIKVNQKANFRITTSEENKEEVKCKTYPCKLSATWYMLNIDSKKHKIAHKRF